MKQLLHSTCLAAILLCGTGFAQDKVAFQDVKEGEHTIEAKYWVCIIGCPKTRVATVRLDSITSVSKHTYSVDGLLFREVTVDTSGNNSIRFYSCLDERMGKAKERLSNTRALIDSKAGNISQFPAKKFPEGAYSHNVEYQVENEADLNKLYDSVVNALFKNKGCTFRVNQ